MISNVLSTPDLEKLRAANLIKVDETATKDGDVIIAINLVTGARRIVESRGLLLECNRQLLKD